ncbi:MLP family protein, partial [Ralstonia pseudosolanacearum]|uniref:MLP family protein n=1 Tax=Ralstonia pseudosolanacearum TaxID=1310165 RepID=UPI003CE67D54
CKLKMAAKDGVCTIDEVTEVKCDPHKFYEMMKYSLHHLPTIYPEGYTDCQILEGDGKSEGSVRSWKYILPGQTDEMLVKCRTVKQDDENMMVSFYVEEGHLHSEYKHMQVTVQVFPKGEEGSLVKWTVEFEKHHDGIADPHAYLEIFKNLNQKVDAHVHKE